MMIKKILLATTVMVFGISAFAGPTSAATQMGGLNASAPVAVDEDGDEEGDGEGGETEVFTIANDTGYTILELYGNAADETDWGEDILGDEDLKDGEELEIHYTPEEDDSEAELYDVKLVWDNPEEEGNEDDIWEDLDLKDAHKVTFHYDDESDTASATVE